jgi:hypothetical protein
MKKGLLGFVLFISCLATKANDTLTRAQVYNFNVGDTFEYSTTKYGGPGFPLNGMSFERRIIVSKYYSPSNDTLFFTIDHIPHGGLPYTETLVLPDTSEREIYLASTDIFCSYIYSVDTNSKYGGRIVNGERPDICFEHYYGDSFAVGLGKVFSWRSYLEPVFNWDVSSTTELIYYSQQGITWGTPMETFTSVDAIRNPKSAFRISPNPASTTLTMQSENTFPPQTTFQLFDLSGRMVLQQEIRDKTNRIDISGVGKGMYLYSVVIEKERVGAGKVIIE